MANKVTIDVKGKTAKVPIEAAFGSGLIKERIELLSTDYVFPMPDRYYPVAGNYINFLNGKPTEITTASKLAACFDMESYFEDDAYFQYLLRQMFDYWSSFGSEFLYGNLSPDIRRSVLLWCPYDFVPIEYIDNPTFFREWLINNENNEISVDQKLSAFNSDTNNKINGKLYYTLVKRYSDGHVKEMTSYHTERDIEIGYKTVVEYNDNGIISSESVYYDRVLKDGIEKEWYPLGNLRSQTRKVNGKLDGEQLIWNNNNLHQLISSTNYVDGKLDGPTVVYYTDGRKKSETNYRYGRKDGISRFWYSITNQNIYYVEEEEHYEDGVLSGEFKKWYDQDQPEVEGQYSHGEKTGHWIKYDTDGSVISEGEYEHDLKTGFWMEQAYVENGEEDEDGEEEYIFITEEGKYNNGNRIGVWTTKAENGSVLSIDRY